jgi:hypothetical protein
MFLGLLPAANLQGCHASPLEQAGRHCENKAQMNPAALIDYILLITDNHHHCSDIPHGKACREFRDQR